MQWLIHVGFLLWLGSGMPLKGVCVKDLVLSLVLLGSSKTFRGGAY